MTFPLPGMVVTGQRARQQSPYAGWIWPTGGGRGGDIPPDEQEETGIDDHTGGGDPLSDEELQCGDPDGNREWNTDAAAARALQAFLERARTEDGDTDGFLSRERHAYIYRRADGSLYFGPIATGPTGQVQSNTEGMTADELIGSVHNHPGGSPTPSGTDWDNFDIIREWIGQHAGAARAAEYRIYVIATDNTGQSPRLGIRVYNNNSSRKADDEGPPVNPDGQPCPGTTITPPA